jgi:hypothetical protein
MFLLRLKKKKSTVARQRKIRNVFIEAKKQKKVSLQFFFKNLSQKDPNLQLVYNE